MKEIKASKINEKVKALFLEANYHIDEDLTNLLKQNLGKETSHLGQYVLKTILENNRMASSQKLPLCQDTGLVIIFVEQVQDVHIIEGDYKKAINQGVKEAYEEGYF